LALPEGIADHGARQATTAAIVGSGEYAGHPGPHTEYLEKIAADEKALSKPTFAAGSEAETITAPGENAGEHVLLVVEFFPDRIGQNRIPTGLASPDSGAVGQLKGNKLLRLLHRNGAQAEGIDQ